MFYLSDQILHIPENSFTYKAKNTIVSTIPVENSKKIEPKRIYIEWIIKKNIFSELSKNNDLFDINYKWGELVEQKHCEEKGIFVLTKI